MAYHLDVSPEDERFIDGCGLSFEARCRLDDFIELSLRGVPDAFRLDPANRPGPSPSVFLAQFALLDGQDVHVFDFHIDDSAAGVGVLRLVYVDHFSP